MGSSEEQYQTEKAERYGSMLVSLLHTAVCRNLPKSPMGGMSVSMLLGERVAHAVGYYVSLSGGLVLNIPLDQVSPNMTLALTPSHEVCILQWLEKMEQQQQIQPGRYVGTWYNATDSTLHVDITLWFGKGERKAALAFAKKQKQIAVWDCAKEVEIRV